MSLKIKGPLCRDAVEKAVGDVAADRWQTGEQNQVPEVSGLVDRCVDQFTFTADTALAAVDNIKEYLTSDGDLLDVTGLLIGYDPNTDALSDFVTITPEPERALSTWRWIATVRVPTTPVRQSQPSRTIRP